MRGSAKSLSVFGAVSIVLILAVSGFAQSTTGVIFGDVKDPSGAFLPGVEISVLNTATNQTRTAITNETGSYNVPLVPIGQYTVTASLPGFKTQVRSGITIQVDQRAKIDFTLEVGALSEKVMVTEQAPLVQAASASLGSVVDNRRVQELPLNSRDFEKLALLIPGASPPQQGSSLSFRGGITIGGANERGNNFTLDGISNTTHNVFTYVYKPSIDEVQEFKVQPNSYDAESGRGEGGQVTVTTKSGTNQYHATLFEFIRNDKLDARNFFDNQGGPKPPFKRNQFGGNIGGPILKDKTFFFVNSEGLRLRQSETRAATVPTDLMRVGNFSELLPATQIRDPLNGQPFAGNIIPVDRLHSIGLKMMSLYPKAVIPGGFARDYVHSTPSPDDSSQTTIRLDHTFSSKDSGFARYSRYFDRFIDAYNQQSGISNLPGYARDDTQHNHAATLSYVHVFGPTLINNFKAGFSRLLQDRRTQDLTDYVKFLGIPGPIVADSGITGVPDIRPTGVEPIGNPSNLPQGRSDLHYQYVDTLSWTKGKHSMKFGADILRAQIFRRSWGNDRGTYRFDGRYSGFGVADMLLGLPNQATRALGDSHSYLLETEMMFFYQDDFRITSHLTLNLGLRYENVSPWYDKFDRMSSYNPDTNTIEIAGTPTAQREYLRVDTLDPQIKAISAQLKFTDIGQHELFRHDTNNFMPRLGFAWDPHGNSKQIIRGGAGVFFTTLTTAQDLGNNYPFRLGSQTFTNTSVPATRIMPPNTYTLSNPFAGVGTATINIIGRQKDFQNGYTTKWSLGQQWEFIKDTVLDVDYSGSVTRKYDTSYNINQPAPGPGNIADRRPIPIYGSISMVESSNNANYNALQTRVERRYSHGLTLTNSYTWQKVLSIGPSGQDPNNRRGDKGPDVIDFRHRWALSVVYELPFGTGRRFLTNAHPILNGVLGGWELSTIEAFQTGRPLTPSLNVDNANTGGSNRPDRINDGNLPKDERSIDRYFDPAAFARPVALYTFGNAGRNFLYGPSANNLDVALMKYFRFKEERSLQLRFEMFNFPNHPNMTQPSTAFGTADFGKIFQALQGRSIQLGLRLKL